MYASCFGESRTPCAKTSLDIETPIEPNHPGSAPMVFNRMSGEELRLAKQWYDEDGKHAARHVIFPVNQYVLCACCLGALK